MTYSALKTTTTEEPPKTAFVPLDDKSIAEHIAKQYQEAGIDPRSAYDTTDEALNDFGGPNAFI